MSGPWVTDAELAAYAEGRLEPDRALEVREALRAFPPLRRKLRALLSARTEAARSPVRTPWFIPPPSALQGGTARRGQSVADVLRGRLRPGDRFVIPIRDVDHPEARQVVLLLHEEDEGWRVAAPTDPEDVVELSALPRGEDGSWLIEVSAAPRPGRQRWAVALPRRDLPVAWDEDDARWDRLREAVARGEVPVLPEEVEVKESE